ncbi:MAG: Crp/Fnr family transcriptional regulator [Sphingobacteriales bacterium]|nr:MAG: Crp/Fnr family transcriptional regulator [Sphingobacteriales bacterium]
MSQLLFDNIQRTVGYDVPLSELEPFRNLFFEKSMDKKTVLAEEGKRCKYIWFLEQGSTCAYYANESGDKTAVQFSIEGHWISDMYSFFSDREALFYIETLEPTDVLFLSRTHFEEACRTIPFVERFFRILTQNALAAQLYRIAKTNSESAEQRYLDFAGRYPHFMSRIPQYLIASYLGIAPQSLSRIRNKLATQR